MTPWPVEQAREISHRHSVSNMINNDLRLFTYKRNVEQEGKSNSTETRCESIRDQSKLSALYSLMVVHMFCTEIMIIVM